MLETRSGPDERTVDRQFEGIGQRVAGTVLELPVTNRAGVPGTTAAVFLNVTAVGPTSAGYLTVWPCGEPQPLASNVNYAAGDVVPNAVLAKLGTGGTVCIYTSATTHIVVDVNGYVPASGTPSSVVPARVLETRSGPDERTVDRQFEGIGQRAAGTVLELPVTNRAGVPGTTAAVFLNVTAVGPTSAGYLTVWPCGEPQPLASNVNYAAGDVVPNAVLAKLGTGGTVCIYTSATTHIVVDVNGYVPASGTPSSVVLPLRRRPLASGSESSCAVDTHGDVWCWGDDRYGALGDGPPTASSGPVRVLLNEPAVSVDVGGAYACALTSTGDVWCWGRNYGGQLGDRTYENSSLPVRVQGIPSVVDIAATNGGNTCVLSLHAEIWCWSGGNGPYPISMPLTIGEFPTNFTSEAGHHCASTSMGRVLCWGANDALQTGVAGVRVVGNPTEVPGAASSVVAGAGFSCAISPSGVVSCWGNNDQEQLGGGPGPDRATPQAMSLGGVVVDMAAGSGYGHACALLESRSITCWGSNESGQLGSANHANHGPFSAGSLTQVRAVSAGWGFTCVALADATARCWGANGSGQLGNNGTAQSDSPITVAGAAVDVDGAVPFTPTDAEPNTNLPPYPATPSVPPFQLSTSIGLVYAVPSDRQAVAGRPDQIAHEVGVARSWLQTQMAGRTLRLVGDGSSSSVRTVQLGVTQSRLENDPFAQRLLEADIRTRLSGTELADAAIVVVVEGNAGYGCGWRGIRPS